MLLLPALQLLVLVLLLLQRRLLRCCCCLHVCQVSGQRDGARLLVTLESKQTDRLDSALARFQELLPHGTVIASQSDVSSLSGGTGATAGSNVSRRNSLGSLQQAMGGSCRCLCPSPKPVAATAAEAAAVTAEAAAMQLTVELAAAQVDGKL